MNQEVTTDPALGRLADAVLIPPFPGEREPAWISDALGDGLGGVTLYGPNMTDRVQLTALTARLRAATSEPVIAVDEEGGDVTRISHRTGSDYPGNAALGAVDDVELTEAVYAALGADLAALGFNLNLAPSADVNTAADNPVIGTRSFGSDPSLVARHVAAAVAGLQSMGVAACAKHFPGHGSTNLDSHHVLATVDAPLSVLRSRDLPPFAAAIEAGVRAIMPGHLRIPELTGDLPASLSARAQTDLLRGELGFTGVIVSDGLEMTAVSEPYGIPEAAVLAVIAGTDLLCLGRETDELMFLAVRSALIEAVRSGRLPGERLEEAAARVAELRAWTAAASVSAPPVSPVSAPPASASSVSASSVPAPPVSAPSVSAPPVSVPPVSVPPVSVPPVSAGASAAAAVATPGRAGAAGSHSLPGDGEIGLAAARRAVLVHGTPPVLDRPLVVRLVPPSNMAAGAVPWGIGDWVPDGGTREIVTDVPADALPGLVSSVLDEATGRSLVVIVRDAHRHPAAAQAATMILDARPDAVVVEMGLPFWRPPAACYLASYGAARSNGRAVAEILGLAQS